MPLCRSMFDWILANKEWVFSGIGVAIIGLGYKLISDFRSRRRKPEHPRLENRNVSDSQTNKLQQVAPVLIARSCRSFLDFWSTYRSLEDRFFEQSEFLRNMKGAQIDWTGFVISVDEHESGSVSVMIVPTKDNRDRDAASAVFSPEWKAKLFSFQRFDKVRIRGRYGGSLVPVMLDGESIELIHLKDDTERSGG